MSSKDSTVLDFNTELVKLLNNYYPHSMVYKN